MSEDSKEDDNSGIQVYLRIRPSSNPSTYFQRDDIDLNNIAVHVPKKTEGEIVNNSRSGYNFSFAGILDDKSSQRDVFRQVGVPALRNALAGYNSTIFAYGQTGSGKTFTITGGPERYEDRGIIPRSIAYLFKAMKNEEQNGTSYACFVSYLEIYNQSGYDLLMESNHSSAASSFDEIPKVTMMEDEFGNFHFKHLSVRSVSSEEDALNLLFLGDTNRAIAATEMNQNSTRSHCIFTILLEKRTAGSDTVTRSKLNIVDLAGSERVSRTNSAGQTLREAKYINSSLFFLEMVIIALHDKEKKRKDHIHVPYRNSMMTSVLRDSLGGNCKTIMIATISPEAQYTDESVSTCHFAQRVALVKNSASVNEEVEPEMVIQRLRAEVRRLREEVEYLSGKNDDDDSINSDVGTGDGVLQLPQHKVNELTESIQRFVRDRDESSHLDFCGGITVPKIRAVCSVFKKMLLSSNNKKLTIDDDRGSISSSEDESEEDDNDKSSVQHSVKNRRVKKKDGSNIHQEVASGKRPSKLDSVCGVQMCTDKRVLDEPNVAFSWFKDRYPGLSAIEKHKNALKQKYAEAKNAGGRIEEIRSRISHHKESIETLRKNRAITDLVSGHVGNVSDDGDGISSDEKFHCDAIDREKAAYKHTLEHLRGLKGSIEKTQEVVKEGRLKLQSDFDTWYHQMCCEQSRLDISGPPTNDDQGGRSSVELSVASSSKKTTRSDEAAPNVVASASSTSEDTKKPPAEVQLPPGIQLTGNAEADADIIAFFRAKEILLSRR